MNDTATQTSADPDSGPAHQMPGLAADPRVVSLIVLATLAVFYTLYVAKALLLPFLLALLLNMLLQPARRFLHERLRMPPPIVAALLIVLLFGVVGGIMFTISLPASGWLAKAPEAAQALEQKLGFLREPIQFVQHGWQQVQQAIAGAEQHQAGAQQAQAQASGGGGLPSGAGVFGLSVLAGTQAFLGQIFTITVLLFFLLSAGDQVFRRVIEVLPDFGAKRRMVEIGEEIQRNISGYLATITVMNLLVGVANGLSMWACGLPDPLLWGTVAFLLNYIPILGPFTGVVVFFFVGLFSYDQALNALIPAGIYLLIHVIEGETVTPMLLASRFTLNPVMVIASLFFWDWMWGVVGALMSVPLLAVAKIVCDRIDGLGPIGHVLGGPPPKRAGRAAA